MIVSTPILPEPSSVFLICSLPVCRLSQHPCLTSRMIFGSLILDSMNLTAQSWLMWSKNLNVCVQHVVRWAHFSITFRFWIAFVASPVRTEPHISSEMRFKHRLQHSSSERFRSQVYPHSSKYSAVLFSHFPSRIPILLLAVVCTTSVSAVLLSA